MKKVVRGAAVALVLAGALAAAAWWLVPVVAKSQIEQRGSEALGRAVTVERVEFDLPRLAFAVTGLAIAPAADDPDRSPQFSLARLRVDASLRSLWALAPVVESVTAEAPRLRLTHLERGRYDIDDVVARLRSVPKDPRADEGPAHFALFNLQLEGGELVFDDRPVGRRHVVDGIGIGVPFLSTLHADVEVTVMPRVAARVNGSPLALQGQALPFAEERTATLALDLDRLALDAFWAYLPSVTPVQPAGGRLTTALRLGFVQRPGAAPAVTLAGTASVDDIAVRTAAGAPLAAWRRLAVDLGELRPLERRLALAAVTLDGAELDLRRRADGALELLQLAAPADKARPASVPAPSSAASGVAAPVPTASWRASLARLAINDARVRWRDASVRPAAAVDLAGIGFEASDLAWPTARAVPLRGALSIEAGGRPAGTLSLEGDASPAAATLRVALRELRLSAAGPYLAAVLRPALEGQADADLGLEWAGGEQPRLVASASSVRVGSLQLREAGSRRLADMPVAIRALELTSLRADLLARRLDVGALRLRQPAVRVRRAADGTLDAKGWLRGGDDTRPAATAPAAAPPWRLALAELRIDNGSGDWEDAAAVPGDKPLALAVRELRLVARGLAWPAAKRPAEIDVAARIPAPLPGEPPGEVKATGRFGLEPLSLQATLDLQRLPVHAVEPYFGAALPVLVRSAELGWKGRVDLASEAAGLRVSATGDALIADLRVQAREGGSRTEGGDELLAWESLSLRPVRVALAPGGRPAVEIGEVVLSDFSSRLVITEEGRFNLRDVQRGASAPAAAASAASTASAAEPARAAASAPEARPAAALPLDLVVGETRFVNGRVDFRDRFIRPSYAAELTELNGRLGRFATGSREMATLEVKGRAAGTALLEIRGALNPTADPLALDISARATDLELAPLSPYAGKYAGYAIERGKLSLDIAYRIEPDGRLQARNQLVLNQLTFGERIESPSATKLPVRLAVALLADRNGVIDIDLPISGSINDPQFSVFGIVMKVIGNLLVKALTAPFSLLFGGASEDLSLVEFVPGTTQIAAASASTVERVAKALGDRPALRLTVAGAADPVSEREAIQAANLDARILAEQRRERARAGAASDASLPPLSADQRAALVRRIYAETRLPNKPRNLIGLAKDIPVAEMEALLRAAVVVSTDSARELALQRGLAVRDALIARGLPAERLFLAAPRLRVSGEEDAAWSPRVQLTLAGP